MKTLKLDGSRLREWLNNPMGTHLVMTLIVDWFPPLTEDQIAANAFAAIDGEPEPYPDPNWIHLEVSA